MALTEGVEIGRVRARLIRRQSGSWEGGALRLHLSRVLGGLDLVPPCLPPSAVLIIRQMRDPLPGKLTKTLTSAQINQEWERRARGQMAEFFRHASRPAQGTVPAGADAVLFMDEGELLACLALDVRRGLARERWWWRSFLRAGSCRGGGFFGHEGTAVLVGRMVRRPQAAVAAIHWLTSRGLGEALMALTPLQAGQVLQAIAAAYRLDVLQFSPSLLSGPLASIAAVMPPWTVGASLPGFGRERAAVLGLSMDLKTRLETVRTHEYQQRVMTWWRSVASGESHPPKNKGKPSAPSAQSGTPEWLEEVFLQEGPPEVHRTKRHRKLVEPGEEKAARKDEKGAGFEDAASRERDSTLDLGPEVERFFEAFLQQTQPDTTSQTTRSERNVGPPLPTATCAGPGKVLPHEEVLDQDAYGLSPPPNWLHDDLRKQQEPVAEQVLAAGLPTELGGVLYLINMMAVLDLPGCFETGWGLASGVGAWGTLDALARELLDDEFSQLREDHIWSVLADLDGRAPELPPGYRMPRSRPSRGPIFEIPPGWLRGLPDLELMPLSSSRLGKIHSAYPPLLAGWIGCVLPFITARLCLALGLATETSLSHVLLRFPARLHLTPSNLDLVASLESISPAVRKAGLDADPGWVPEFGRFIRFHFE